MSQAKPTRYFKFDGIFMASGWQSPGYVGVDDNGVVISVSADAPVGGAPIENVAGLALPGFQNAHSHAFQFAMAGMAELHKPGSNDDFWSWREAMYQCALSFDADQLQVIATALYIEMLKRGYTHVAEFHYVHHDKNGKAYSNPAEIGVAMLAAAAVAGIKITLTPVFYQKGGFGQDAFPRQRRFIFRNVDEYFRLLESSAEVASKMTTASMAFGVHSLRAADTKDVLTIATQGPKNLPFHIHAAEQLKEVSDSLSLLRQRPVEWMLNNLSLSERFNLVHCTHMNDEEVRRLAASGAQVVLCPGTEGSLGDGIFRFTDYSRANGNWCIGTDSHISLNPLEDLRWIDYAQRLVTHKRNTFDDGGVTLIIKAYSGGQRAMGKQSTGIAPGQPLDVVVYDSGSPLLQEVNNWFSLSRILYTADSGAVLGTIVNGKWVVKDRHHREEEKSSQQFKEALRAISIV